MPTPPTIKASILEDIQKNGMTMTEAATKYQVSYKTIHGWFRKQSTGTAVSWSEYQRLRTQNQRLKEIIGELTFQHSRTKKI
jgi:transposase-like protein